jgi:photosystem II stability/assembly factor-like uncharacterized protein
MAGSIMLLRTVLLLACAALLAPPDQPAIFSIEQLAFFDATHGWVLGSRCGGQRCTLELHETKDGGATWRERPVPEFMRLANPADRRAASRLFFSGPDTGWIYGPGLYATRDGGRSWESVPTDGAVFFIAAAGPAMWRLEQPYAQVGPVVHTVLRVSADGGRMWGGALPSPGRPFDGYAPDRIFPRDARVAYFDVGPPGALDIMATGDGGRTWRRLAQPCSRFSLGASLTVHARRLWLLCTGDPAVGTQAKQLFRSNDAGRTWDEMSDSETRRPGGLAQLGYMSAPIALSPSRLVAGHSRGPVIASDDAGRTWRAVLSDERFLTNHVGPLVFHDDRHGWASVDNTVYLTRDGGRTWAQADIP